MSDNTEFLDQNSPQQNETVPKNDEIDNDVETETVVTTQKRRKRTKTSPDQLNTYLKTLPGSWKISIDRLSPSWAAGHCGHMEIDPDDPFDIEEIKEEWGGNRLRIRVLDEHGNQHRQTTIRFAEPPRNEGQIMKRYQEEPQRPQNAQPDFGSQLVTMLIAQQQAQSDLTKTLIQSSLDNSNKQIPPPPVDTSPASPMAPLRDAMKLMKEMEGLTPPSPSDLGGESDGGIGTFITPELQTMFGQILTAYFQNRADMQKIHTQQAANAAAAAAPAPPTRVIQQPPPARRRRPKPVSDDAFLQELEQRFERMSQEQKKQAMVTLMGDRGLVDFDDDEDGDDLDGIEFTENEDNFQIDPQESTPSVNSINNNGRDQHEPIPLSDSDKVTLSVDLGNDSVEGNDCDESAEQARENCSPPGFNG